MDSRKLFVGSFEAARADQVFCVAMGEILTVLVGGFGLFPYLCVFLVDWIFEILREASQMLIESKKIQIK